jgi:hypothetical protein
MNVRRPVCFFFVLVLVGGLGTAQGKEPARSPEQLAFSAEDPCRNQLRFPRRSLRSYERTRCPDRVGRQEYASAGTSGIVVLSIDGSFEHSKEHGSGCRRGTLHCPEALSSHFGFSVTPPAAISWC